jgi:hypothetical protein
LALGLLALPWLLGLLPDAPEGLPNNIIHPTRLMGIASGGSYFGRVMMSVGPSRCAADSTAIVYYQAFNISSFIIIIAGQPVLQVCRLIISYTLWEAMKAMEHAFLPIIEVNRKGNLKSGRIYLL